MSEQLTLHVIPSTTEAPDRYNLERLAPAQPTIAYDSYWRFAAERQAIFFRRLAGLPLPWTSDPVLSRFKFTNVYRACDRVSQYLLKQVIYNPLLPSDPKEVFFRILLFKIFNKVETWEALSRRFGAVTFKTFDKNRYSAELSRLLSTGTRIYSAAYIMPSGDSPGTSNRKHDFHLHLISTLMADEAWKRIQCSKTLQEVFELLKSYPSIGNFLAYQFAIDLNYSELIDFSENSFVVPGPGAKDGISKCFSSLGGLSEVEIIKLVCDLQEEEFAARDLNFQNLFGRKLHLIDCQNLFCEVDKYSRAVHPTISGRTGRSKIKQKFAPKLEPIDYFFPPKWKLPPSSANR